MNGLPIDQQLENLLKQIERLVGRRSLAEDRIPREAEAEREQANAERQKARETIAFYVQHEKDKLAEKQQQERTKFETEHAAERRRVQQEGQRLAAQEEEAFAEEMNQATEEHQNTLWTAETLYEASKRDRKQEYKEIERSVIAGGERLHELRGLVHKQLKTWNQEVPEAEEENGKEVTVDPTEPLGLFREQLGATEESYESLAKLFWPRLLQGKRPVWLVVGILLISLLFGVLLGKAIWDELIIGTSIGIGTGIVASLIFLFWVKRRSQREIDEIMGPLLVSFNEAKTARKKGHDIVVEAYRSDLAKFKLKYETEISQAQRAFDEYREKRLKEHEESIHETTSGYPKRLEALQAKYTEALAALEKRHKAQVERIDKAGEEKFQLADEKYDEKTASSRALEKQRWELITREWNNGLERFLASVKEIKEANDSRFQSWAKLLEEGVPLPSEPTPIVRFGDMKFSFSKMKGGIPKDERFDKPEPKKFQLPALAPFPECGALIIKAQDEARRGAESTLQAVMHRVLTSMPPGKVRLTIIDPVGLGQHFAAFMHLADYDELLVTNRIWTESRHIDERLTDLTAHMETVIQKYLRNEFASIGEYNEEAGEVAEAFRLLVIANFPANFSDAAARRLVSIVSSGARCGVVPLISVDTKQPLPREFQLSDLEEHAEVLEWDGQAFRWKRGELEHYPLTVEEPPSPELATQLMQRIGERSREASRVEVPFDFITPAEEDWWNGDCSRELSVAIGRSGATKRRHLQLGHGTSQHVLLAGKTGSGKSTVLHILVVNLALTYSPDEVQLYLIDFKKGVEFKTYATHRLPHARVIAVESEREFGLSVMQRLDAEMKARGDLFREMGVNDLGDFREKAAQENHDRAPLPRILLVVDEFQEFFVGDDAIAQDAALLLDRLVRQGRAFGIHVLLGSQTLGGAYTLARSTIGQMAVRIALQCSEADAHLILGEDNSAAKLLTRPGEAIYNDASGALEGNHPFQVAWLDDWKRDHYLALVSEKSASTEHHDFGPPIIFEGNRAPDLRECQPLGRALASGTWVEQVPAAKAWIGEAVAIKDPTEIVFRSQGGSHVLIVGQNEQGATGEVAASVLSLASQLAPISAAEGVLSERFLLLDGTPADAPTAGVLKGIFERLPQDTTVASPRTSKKVIENLWAELQRRQECGEEEFASIYLFVHDLQRFRELRRDEDDFGYSRGDEPPTPDKQFAGMLKDGAVFGIHVVCWCDSVNNLNRTLERASLREFESRILFQMSANDSSTLIDTPAAGRLGRHRALYVNEEQGIFEKFRPYGIPSDEMIEDVIGRLAERPAPIQEPTIGEGA
ncbi:FtsK-like domain-containing protein [Planctomycetes bacterium Pan216]|uniref:FtsK-like domain-containing protein n=1 Tax=Kolteria novifilia TaxID=2527975 RepID=A0A518B395_9BACT|nr:FtsK-like domain-containing protein [Planctomycetes bacterium Pan216]